MAPPSRPLRLARTIAVAAAVATVTPVGVAAPAAADTASRSVSATGTAWVGHAVQAGPGRLDVALTWQGGADLNLFLADPQGRSVARSTASTGTVERLSVTVPAAGRYRIGVKAVRGSATFTLQHSQAGGADGRVGAEAAPVGASVTSLMSSWVAANENTSTVTQQQALTTARQHDVVTARPTTYAPYASQMRAANPRLRLFAYTNGTFAQKNQGTAFPESWYARDAQGRKITSKGWGNYLMNPAVPGWRDNRVSECRAVVQRSGYDGCMLDMLGTAPIDAAYVTSLPVNPTTKQVWTRGEWLTATTRLADAVRAANGHQVVGNGAGNGARYFDTEAPSRVLNDGTDAAIAEVWMRGAMAPLNQYPNVTRWKQSVDQLVDAGRAGETVLTMTKLWATGTTAEKDRWHAYALASFLLGTDGQAAFTASYSRTGDHTVAHPWWSVDLGAPLGAYRPAGSAYVREFSGGWAVVNPTTGTVRVPLPRPMRGLDGVVRSELTLVGQRGAVMTG